MKSQLIFSSLVSFSTIITIIYTDENISCVFVVFEFEDGMDQSFSTWSCSRFVIILPRCRTDYSSIRRSFFSLCVYMYWVCRVVCRCMLIFGLKILCECVYIGHMKHAGLHVSHVCTGAMNCMQLCVYILGVRGCLR